MNTIPRSGIVLGSCTLIAIALLVTTHALTRDRIYEAQHSLRTQRLSEVLPEGPFDNNPLASLTHIIAPALGSEEPEPLYTVYRNNKPLAAILTVVAPDGYNGSINLLLGVNYQGVVTGVRVIQHRETPGLGDDIEPERSNWIHSFTGQALSTSTPRDWQVRKRGGQFDAFTGATITPTAVVAAVHRALQWYQKNRDTVFKS